MPLSVLRFQAGGLQETWVDDDDTGTVDTALRMAKDYTWSPDLRSCPEPDIVSPLHICVQPGWGVDGGEVLRGNWWQDGTRRKQIVLKIMCLLACANIWILWSFPLARDVVRNEVLRRTQLLAAQYLRNRVQIELWRGTYNLETRSICDAKFEMVCFISGKREWMGFTTRR